MRYNLQLSIIGDNDTARLTLNYQYLLSMAISRIIARSDREIAAYLNDRSYLNGRKQFRYFTFSDLRVPFEIDGDRMILTSGKASLTVCFHLPDAARHFIKGLFLNQQIDLADQYSRTSFLVEQVGIDHLFFPSENNSRPVTVNLRPMSPMVVGHRNPRGSYDYLSPYHEDFTDCLLHSWIEKYKSIRPVDKDQLKRLLQTKIDVYAYDTPTSRLITIKEGTPEVTRIRGFTRFNLQITAMRDFLELGLHAGLGLYGHLGFGSVEICPEVSKYSLSAQDSIVNF